MVESLKVTETLLSRSIIHNKLDFSYKPHFVADYDNLLHLLHGTYFFM